jgi:hypothetical protein
LKEGKATVLSIEVSKNAAPTKLHKIGTTLEVQCGGECVALLEPGNEPGMRRDRIRFLTNIEPSILELKLSECLKFSGVLGQVVDEKRAVAELRVQGHFREPRSGFVLYEVWNPDRTSTMWANRSLAVGTRSLRATYCLIFFLKSV